MIKYLTNFVISDEKYEFLCGAQKKDFHARVIWSCCWIHDSYMFITGSRDKTINIWDYVMEGSTENWTRKAVFKASNEVTAVDSTKVLKDDKYIILIAIGK